MDGDLFELAFRYIKLAAIVALVVAVAIGVGVGMLAGN